jgi:toxin-antitoxin system PIN domain toxin
VIVVDLNLLLYAVNSDAPHHRGARAWWQATLDADEPVGLAWVVVLGFVRIATNPRILPHPIQADQALEVVDEWLAGPPVRLLEPTERHWPILADLLRPLGAAGNLVTDAHVAALAIEHGATLCSTDNDFSRFPGLRWRNPLAPGAR